MPIMLRHVGRLASTDSKCVVVMMQIPGNMDHALIVESDSLPDRMHQAVMEAVESNEGQQDDILANVLGRKPLPDGGGVDIMNALHTSGRLRPVPIDQVIMVPSPGNAFPLKTILESLGKLSNDPNAEEIPADLAGQDPNELFGFNPHAHNQDAIENEDTLATAKGILIQANMLQAEANGLYEKAYRAAPSLRPAPTATAPKAKPKAAPAGGFIDKETGKSYKTEAALKSAITRRTNLAKKG